MRWTRLFLLGLASIYPLYWMAQFVLFFLPASLHALFQRLPLTVVDISYLQVTAVAGKSDSLPAGIESLLFAMLFSAAIWYLRGDKFLTGGLAIVVLGQSALLPFLSQLLWMGSVAPLAISGLVTAMGMICFGLYRILRRTGGVDFVDRLALLSLLAVLPQAALWLAFRMRYPFFGTKFLLMLLAPLYLGALIASALPHDLARDLANSMRPPAPLVEIVLSLVAASLLFAAIGLTTRSGERQHSIAALAVYLARPA
jgi:hypothetical protein